MKMVLFEVSLLLHFVLPSISAARIICYFPNWATYRQGDGKYSVNNINPNLCTHLIYAFAVLNETSYRIQEFDSWADIDLNGYSKFVALKTQNPNLKTMISIGGVVDSTDGTGKYSKLVSSSINIQNFVRSVLKFLQKYGFDGLDLDWEFPSTPSDKVGFVNLTEALRSAFNPKGYLLSAATTTNENATENGFDLDALNKTLDFINLMAYDMHGPAWEPTLADHHAPLYKRSWDKDTTNNIYSNVRYYLSRNFSAAKINLGIPFYGKAWTLSANVTTPPAPGSGLAQAGPILQIAGSLAYSEICYYILNSGWKVVNDSLGLMGPYAYSPVYPIQWVGYDDPEFVTIKARYALEMGLGGVIVWDVSQDDFTNKCGLGYNPLLTAISQVMLPNSASSSFLIYSFFDGIGSLLIMSIVVVFNINLIQFE